MAGFEAFKPIFLARQLLGLHGTLRCVLIYIYASCICIEIMSLLYCVARTVAELSDCVKTNYIKTRYFTQEGIWYHLSPKHFVNVLLIHHMEQGGEKGIVDIAVLMREGLSSHCQLSQFNKAQPSNIVSTHDISDIFKPFKKSDGTTIIAEVIIIDGAPGMGKTTLSKEIAYRWANSQLLDDTKLVFFVYLRDPEIQRIHDLESFIHYFKNYDQAAASFSKQCANILINRSNDDVMIILDGYDEYFDASGDSFINRIINRKVFAKSKLIITSRPTATDRLQHIGDIRVEVMGFADDSKKEYIKQELKNHSDKMEKLFSYLNNHQTINSICYIPMIMTILVCTFREIEELPSDQTELYEKFITLAISRYVEKLENKPNPKILPLKHLPELYKKYLFELSKFAFYNLKDDKIVFMAEDIEKFCPMLSSANKDFHGLGLLKSTQYFSMKKIDNCVSYNFLHLSLQEYLAAYYINLLNPCKQFELLKNSLFVEKYTNSWIMFARLGKKTMFDLLNYSVYGIPCNELRNKLLPHISNLNPPETFSQTAKLCANECVLGTSKLLCFKNSEVKCHEDILLNSGSVDDLALLNKLNFTEFNWNKLYLSLHNTNGNLMEGFVIDKNSEETLYCKIASELYTERKYSVVIVNVSTLIGYRANKQQVSDGLAMNDSIVNLIMKKCHIGDETAKIISFYIKTSNMIIATFENCTFNNSASKITFEALSSISSLRVLIINNTNIDDVAVASVIKSNTGIELLSLGNNKLGAGALKIVRALKEISSLKVLDLNNNTSGIIADDLAAVIDHNSLQKLRLANNDLRSCASTILQSLSKITTLTHLNLSGNDMSEEVAYFLASAIASNSSLEDLILTDNRLTTSGIVTIAKSLSNISTLKYLSVQNNLISEEAADSIASVIKINTGIGELYLGNNKLGAGALKIIRALKEVSSLKVLDLNNNNTSGIIADDLAAVIDHNSLQKLWLANNDLRSCASTILQSLSKITTLTHLNLSGNDMSEEVAYFLASAIASNSSLEDLRLTDNRLTTSGIVTIAKSLSNISTLKYLIFQSNLISEEAADYIASVIKINTGIEELYLGNNKLGTGALKIIRALKEVSSLKVLDLNNNNTSGIIADDLAAVIDHNSLQKLRLAKNDLRSCASTILQSLSKITTLTHLNLSGNDMSEGVAYFLASAIASNSSLEDLRLTDNRLTTSGIVTIAKSLSNISTLKYLSVQNNLISEEAADSIASVIKINTGIGELYIGNNKLGAGALKIIRALKEVSSLKVLDLNNNNTSGIIADDLAAVIDHNSLQKLWLANNDLRSCASTILQSLSKITTLTHLNLSGNDMSEDVAYFLASAIASNSSLEDLILTDNRLTTSGIVTIAKSLSNISTLKYLIVHSNLISEEAADSIASVIKINTGIEELYLGNNKLGAGALKIIRALKEVSSLKVLDLGNNNTSGIIADDLAAVIDHNSLQKLWLANNDLRSCASTILQSLSKITTLAELDLSGNDMSEGVADFLASAIASNSSLEYLRLTDNRLTTSGIVTIAKSLSNISTLKYLSVQSNLISEEAADYIASVIKINTGIGELYLGNNKLGVGALKIIRALKEVSSLKVLDLDNNNTSGIIADDLATVIDHNSLQKLWLANNDLRSCASTILQSLSKITTLTQLNLSGNDMSEEVADFLISVISSNSSLVGLGLSDNRLTTSGIITIAKSLSKLSRLKALDISNILITKEAADAVVSVISKINTLTSLYLGNCYMSDGVANDLATAIRSNCSLEGLQLKNNRLKTSGLMTICQSLQQLSTLTHFNIRNNKITEETAECIASVILSNNRIQELYLGDNRLHNETVVIIRALQSVSSLVVLYLSNMKMTEEVAGDLVLAINNNPLLKKLYLAGNLLSSSLIEVAKACKKSTKHLIVLDLQCNCVDPSKMTDLTSVTGDINTLKALLLGGLSMSTVDQMFDKFLCHLEMLNLHGTKVDLESFEEYSRVELLNMEMQKSSIAHTFKRNYQLSYIPYDATDTLHIDLFNPQQVIDQHSFLYNLEKVKHKVNATIMIKSLSVISTLMVLDLEHSNVDETAAFELATKLHSNNVLQQLWLRGNQLNTAGAMFISNSLKCMSTLQVLDLSFNSIGYQSADNVVAVIYSNPTLKQLWLDGNGLLDTGVVQICRALKHVSKLRILSLCSNGISDDSAEELSAAISSNDLLEDLLLGNNNLQSVGICKIVHSLNNVVRLRKLDLFHNGVTKEVTDELAVTISNCYTLQELYLSDNMLGTIGALKIFESLKHKSKLQVLTLSNNNITDEVIGELCFVLARNPRLQVLLIGGNKLQTDGVITIAGVVKCENIIMSLLALCENYVSEQGKEQVKMMFSDNPDIHVYV